VPWARHAAGHTRAFDAQVASLATQCSKTAVTELMRIAWRTVDAVITRVWDDVDAVQDRFAGVRRIGIDEISDKRGHRYLVVVVDHDTGRLVWAAPGKGKATLHGFFDALSASGDAVGEDRCAAIAHVSADGAHWIEAVVRQRCLNAVRRPVPHRALGHRSPRRGAPRGLEHRSPRGRWEPLRRSCPRPASNIRRRATPAP
jgi:transposase